MSNVGTLTVQVGADIAALKRAQIDANATMKAMADNMGKNAARAERNTKKSFNAVRVAAVAMVAAIGSVKAAIDIGSTGAKFEHSMAKVKGVMEATEEEAKRLTKVARKMGETTEWSARQAAGGLEFLGMAGLSAEQSIQALPATLDLATAGNIELARAADIATNAMSAMRLPVSELGRVNDTFVKTITSSNTNMEQLAESFKYAAPLASGMGFEIEELSAYIGLLGSSGIQGSMAGTQLAFSFTKMSKAFAKYGVSATNADGSSKGLIEALELLEKNGASATEVMELFGARGGKAVLALLGQGTKKVREYMGVVQNSTGASEKLATTMRSTTVGAFKELKSVIESIKIDAFSENANEMQMGFRDLTKTIRENKDTLIAAAGAMVKAANASLQLLTNLMKIGEFAGKMVDGPIEDGSYEGQLKRINEELYKHRGVVEGIKSGYLDATKAGENTLVGRINTLMIEQAKLQELLDKAAVGRSMAAGVGSGNEEMGAVASLAQAEASVKPPTVPVAVTPEVSQEAKDAKAAEELALQQEMNAQKFAEEIRAAEELNDMWAVKEKEKYEVHSRYLDLAIKKDEEAAKKKMSLEKGVIKGVGNIRKIGEAMAASGNKTGFKIAKAAAIGETIINTGKAAMGAYSAMAGIPYIGPVLGVIAAGAAVAAGAQQISTIRSTSMGGGGTPSAPTGGGGAGGVTADIPDGLTDFEETTGTAREGQAVNFYNYGTVADSTQLAREQSEFLVDAEEDGVNRF